MFSERLKQLRQKRGLNQKELAELLGVEPSKYNKWENGKNCPNYDTLCKLANFWGSTTDYLLGNSDQMYQDADKALNSGKDDFKAQVSNRLIDFIKTM